MTNLNDYAKDTISSDDTSVEEDYLEKTTTTTKGKRNLYQNRILIEKYEGVSGTDKFNYIFQTTFNGGNEVATIRYFEKGDKRNYFYKEIVDDEEGLDRIFFDLSIGDYVLREYKTFLEAHDNEYVDSESNDNVKETYEFSITGTKLNEEMKIVFKNKETRISTGETKGVTHSYYETSTSEFQLHIKDGFLDEATAIYTQKLENKEGEASAIIEQDDYSKNSYKYTQGEKQVYTGTLLTKEDL